MKKFGIITLLVFVSLTAVIGLAISYGSSQVLGTQALPDGNEMQLVAKPRLCGLLGIEIVEYKYSPEGRKLSGSVTDLCGSWSDVEEKYTNPKMRMSTPASVE